ncbi:MAG TPA: hypothetical protein VFW12_06650 [Candidatus Limnocylindria bacterium]|nr:hypothetical protein [Candidatus Limnocylindria bacterium]
MPPKDFDALSEAEARAFLERYVATATERLERFLDLVEETGGPSRATLDRSPESLVLLHVWSASRARRADAPDAAGTLPAWYEPDPPELASQRLAPRTIADADGVALYFAEVLRRGWPELTWDIGKEPKRFRYAHQHKPLLKAGEVDIDVIGIAYGMGVRVAIMGTGREPEALLDVYRAWIVDRPV